MFKSEKNIYNNHYAIDEVIPEANTDHIKRKKLDISYADSSPSQKFDIYWPEEGDGPFPVIVVLHGGAFMGGDKASEEMLPMLTALNRGYVVVSANYRLSWEAKFPALIYDIKAAVRWIRANSHLYKINPDKIAVWGGSAGAYISLFMGVSAGLNFMEDNAMGNPGHLSNVQAVVSWFSPTNFLEMDRQLSESGLGPVEGQRHNGVNSPESLLLGRKITEIPELVRLANPENYIMESAPPFFIQHGTKDSTVPVQQGINFTEKLTKILGNDNVKLELINGAEHADEAFETTENIKKVLDFLDSVLK